jgi:hypothetical protein
MSRQLNLGMSWNKVIWDYLSKNFILGKKVFEKLKQFSSLELGRINHILV